MLTSLTFCRPLRQAQPAVLRPRQRLPRRLTGWCTYPIRAKWDVKRWESRRATSAVRSARAYPASIRLVRTRASRERRSSGLVHLSTMWSS